ncbi:MAG: endonuclease domain-containing protein [Bacteroidota bacterium]
MTNRKDVLKDEGMHAGAKADTFAYAYILRQAQTPQEKKLWGFLRTKPKGLKFRRQYPFSHYVLDFYCHVARLVIELDGPQHKSNLEYDHDRTTSIEGYGLKVIRFENQEVDHNFSNVKKRILKLL